jgi:hypothetical protein
MLSFLFLFFLFIFGSVPSSQVSLSNLHSCNTLSATISKQKKENQNKNQNKNTIASHLLKVASFLLASAQNDAKIKYLLCPETDANKRLNCPTVLQVSAQTVMLK